MWLELCSKKWRSFLLHKSHICWCTRCRILLFSDIYEVVPGKPTVSTMTFLKKNCFPSLTSKTWHSRAWVAEKTTIPWPGSVSCLHIWKRTPCGGEKIFTQDIYIRVCVLLPDRYVIVTRYFVLDDIFRRFQLLNIIERGWLPKNSK